MSELVSEYPSLTDGDSHKTDDGNQTETPIHELKGEHKTLLPWIINTPPIDLPVNDFTEEFDEVDVPGSVKIHKTDAAEIEQDVDPGDASPLDVPASEPIMLLPPPQPPLTAMMSIPALPMPAPTLEEAIARELTDPEPEEPALDEQNNDAAILHSDAVAETAESSTLQPEVEPEDELGDEPGDEPREEITVAPVPPLEEVETPILVEELERELIATMLEEKQKSQGQTEADTATDSQPASPERDSASKNVENSCDDLLSAAVIDSLSGKLPPIRPGVEDPPEALLPMRSPVAAKPTIRWDEPVRLVPTNLRRDELMDRLSKIFTPNRVAFFSSSLILILAAGVFYAFGPDLNPKSLFANVSNVESEIDANPIGAPKRQVRLAAHAGSQPTSTSEPEKEIASALTSTFGDKQFVYSAPVPSSARDAVEKAVALVPQQRFTLTSAPANERAEPKFSATGFAEGSNGANASLGRSFAAVQTDEVPAGQAGLNVSPNVTRNVVSPGQTIRVKTVRTKLLPISDAGGGLEIPVAPQMQTSEPVRAKTLSVVPSNAQKAGTQPGANQRRADQVDVALSSTLGISQLSAQKRVQLKNQLVRGDCPAAALSEAFDRVPVLTMRDLVKKIDGEC